MSQASSPLAAEPGAGAPHASPYSVGHAVGEFPFVEAAITERETHDGVARSAVCGKYGGRAGTDRGWRITTFTTNNSIPRPATS